MYLMLTNSTESDRLELSSDLLASIRCQERVLGMTHGFYRYPARFSPQLARAIIERFTDPGDVVLDPFCGGATTLVEAAALGRKAVGTDINPLAIFLARVKTLPLKADSRAELRSWAKATARVRLSSPPTHQHKEWRELGYQKHLNTRKTWPIRKYLELLLDQVLSLSDPSLRDFARCAVLRAGQWALDGRRTIPSVGDLRAKFFHIMDDMLSGMAQYASKRENESPVVDNPICLLRSASELHCEKRLRGCWPPKLVLTSPPYPGVHVLYHRWQVAGRRETPAPFWITSQVDGKGESHYTFGSRKRHDERVYFDSLRDSFRSIRTISDEQTIFAQVIGFSKPTKQFDRYLKTLSSVGLDEVIPTHSDDQNARRIWRTVPSRKWYANLRENLSSGHEVLFLHRLSKNKGKDGTTAHFRRQAPIHLANE